jgi:hypothetical protein
MCLALWVLLVAARCSAQAVAQGDHDAICYANGSIIRHCRIVVQASVTRQKSHAKSHAYQRAKPAGFMAIASEKWLRLNARKVLDIGEKAGKVALTERTLAALADLEGNQVRHSEMPQCRTVCCIAFDLTLPPGHPDMRCPRQSHSCYALATH